MITREMLAHFFEVMMWREPTASELDDLFAKASADRTAPVALLHEHPEFQMKNPSSAPKPIYDDLRAVTSNGVEFLVPVNDWVHWATRAGHDWEPWIVQQMTRFLSPGTVFLDVGANVGALSMVGARLVGETGQVYAVEASLEVAMVLLANVRHANLQNTFVIPRAVTDASRREHVMVGHGTSNRFVRPEPIPAKRCNFEPILTDTLDSMLGHLDRLELIKIDVEGREGSALRGGKELIERTRPAIIAEYHYRSEEYWFADDLIAMGYEVSVLETDCTVVPFGKDHTGLRAQGAARELLYSDLLFTPQ